MVDWLAVLLIIISGSRLLEPVRTICHLWRQMAADDGTVVLAVDGRLDVFAVKLSRWSIERWSRTSSFEHRITSCRLS